MKKKAVCRLRGKKDEKTALYIVAHAKWQKSRNRRPSESYKNEVNSLKALDLALNELLCHDCGAKPGEVHELGCDTERCPCCKGQLISCGCCNILHPGWKTNTNEDGDYWWPPDSKRLAWSGIMFEEEVKIAERDNKFVRWKESPEFKTDTKNFCFHVNHETGWIPCNKDHPDARPDINYGGTKTAKLCPF